MGQTVECFYTLSSPWMYLGGPQLSEILKRHGATLLLKPYDFRLVIKHTGGIPLRTRPEPRQDYHALELDRWSRYLKMPIKLKPKHYPPTDQMNAGRMVMAAQARGLDAFGLSQAILRALWVEDRDIADGEVVTACQGACPSQAIVFGNINDPKSRVSQLKAQPLNYGLLTELNTKPRTTYLARLRNPNPALEQD